MPTGTEKKRPIVADASFLPNFCSIPVVFALVVGGQLLAFVLVFAAGWPAGGLWEQFSLVALYVQWVALCTAALLCLSRRQLAALGDMGAGLIAWLLLMLITGLAAEVARALAESLAFDAFFRLRGRWELLGRSLGISGIVGALALRYAYLDNQWRRQVVARSEARYQALQARIRPHFLFNSMNTVASLTRTDPARAEAVIEDLSDLFRAALSNPEGGSTLERELELIRRYLDVEQQRLGAARLQVVWDLQELPGDARLPLLTLQPLVENAVYHGVEPCAQGGVIRVAGRFRNGRINLSIRNTLPPQAGGSRHRKGNHMALENVRQRLHALYPNFCSLTQGRVEGEFQVRVVFPYPGGAEES